MKFWRNILGLSAMVATLAGCQTGLLAGSPPTDLGVRNGRLAPPSSTPNSVSSQAGLYPDHPRHSSAQVAPLRYTGDAAAAMVRLDQLMTAWPRTRIVERTPIYLRAECSTALMGFTDDVEFLLDAPAQAIQVRSASRLGYGDLGANRARVDAIRARFQGTP